MQKLVSLLSLVTLSCSGIAWADSIFLDCGPHAEEGRAQAEYSFVADTLDPTERSEWTFYIKGKASYRAKSVVVLPGKFMVKGYVVTDRQPDNGHAYHQYIFGGIEKCQEGGPAILHVYQVGAGHGRVLDGKPLECVCDID